MNFSDKCRRDGSTGLFRGLTLSAAICAAALAPITAGAAEYTEGMSSIVLMAGSADGTTNTLAGAISEYNAANGTSYDVSSFNGGDLAAYALVKEGDGTLVMDEAISGFTGPVVIKDGVVKCMCQYALGADTTDSHVYVRDGATFYVKRLDTGDNIKNNNRNLHVAGTGHNGQAALNVDPVRKSNVWNTLGLYGKTLSLDGDATVAPIVIKIDLKRANINAAAPADGDTDQKPQDNGPRKSPQTGDAFTLVALVFVAAVTVLCAALIKGRKTEE